MLYEVITNDDQHVSDPLGADAFETARFVDDAFEQTDDGVAFQRTWVGRSHRLEDAFLALWVVRNNFV